ncbi:recombinase family protein [Leisingera aquaemixtae]|uniref:recombinase family protein n=1 Tax=Leisingera aquaemixtae TaxID=1396826 RepID=UPI0035CCF9AB
MFGHDASSRFAEEVQALFAQYERERIVETAKSRSVARLRNGYWVFPKPPGYKYEKDIGGGKVLVRDEPVATIVENILNGFASGRFQSQAEILRYLNANPGFPKGRSKKPIKIDLVTRLLKNVLYAGYLQQEKWGVPLTKAKHEALITYETFQVIQSRLNERAVAPARPNIKRDFVVSGVMKCGNCGRGITYCWSRSHSGKKYPYYLCPNRTCPDGGKSIRRGKLERGNPAWSVAVRGSVRSCGKGLSIRMADTSRKVRGGS